MFNKLGAGLVGMVVAACLCQQAKAPSYVPGPLLPDADIQHQTVSPFNSSRTEIGIGESVNCWIDPSTWQNPDIYIDGEGNRTNVSGTVRTPIWSANGAGSVYPIVGVRTTLTADLTDADATVTVQATLFNSR